MRIYQRLSYLSLGVILVGCAGVKVDDPSASSAIEELSKEEARIVKAKPVDSVSLREEGSESVALAMPSTVTKPPSSNQAVASLIGLSQRQRDAGKLDAATSTLERALRVDPRNPVLWHHLADLRFAQSKPNQAIQLAVKSNTFAVADRSLQAKNWRLIGQVKAENGDMVGAQDAYGRAESLQP